MRPHTTLSDDDDVEVGTYRVPDAGSSTRAEQVLDSARRQDRGGTSRGVAAGRCDGRVQEESQDAEKRPTAHQLCVKPSTVMPTV